VAERHGLNIRTVSRHARDERWQAPRMPALETYELSRQARDFDPEAIDSMAAVQHVFNQDQERLLMRPDTVGLCRFAFRRAAEAASVSGPTEALAWLRLAEATARLRQRVDVDVHPMSEADYRRIVALEHDEMFALDKAVAAAPPEDSDRPAPPAEPADPSVLAPVPAKVSEVSESVP
jgi:hypothetical protein